MKYLIISIIIFYASVVFSQVLVIKKADGTFEQFTLNNDVEVYVYGPCPGTEKVYYEGGPNNDVGGDYYNTVQIGEQCWLRENLDVGTRIDGANNQTNNSAIEKYCYNDLEANCLTYGGLYQWDEAMQYIPIEGAQGICPGNWHVPKYYELLELSNAVGEDGNALKAIGQGSGEGAGTNASGFSALLAGLWVWNPGYFSPPGFFGSFWCSRAGTNWAFQIGLSWNNSSCEVILKDKAFGYSIRCIKD